MGMVGEACLPSNAYYPRTPDYTLCSGVHVCWSEHSDSSFVYGFMILDYGFGTMTATTIPFFDNAVVLFREDIFSNFAEIVHCDFDKVLSVQDNDIHKSTSLSNRKTTNQTSSWCQLDQKRQCSCMTDIRYFGHILRVFKWALSCSHLSIQTLESIVDVLVKSNSFHFHYLQPHPSIICRSW